MRFRSASYRFARLAMLPGLALVATALSSPMIHAQGLPTLEDPSRGAGGEIMETLQNYGYDIVLLIALLVVASISSVFATTPTALIRRSTPDGRPGAQFGLTVAGRRPADGR